MNLSIIRILTNIILSRKLLEIKLNNGNHFFTASISRGTHYRIAYKVVNNIIVIMISSRENFYRDLSR